MRKMEITTTCRICLQEEKKFNLTSLLDIYVEDMTYADLITYCTGFTVFDANKNYPTNICRQCEDVLLKCYEFKIKIKEANFHLESLTILNAAGSKYRQMENVMEIKVEPVIGNSFHVNTEVDTDNPIQDHDDTMDVFFNKTPNETNSGWTDNKVWSHINNNETQDETNNLNKEIIEKSSDVHLIQQDHTLLDSPLHNSDTENSPLAKVKTKRSTKSRQKVKLIKQAFCRICDLTFPDTIELNKHRKNEHYKKSRKLCLICGKLTSNTDHFETHKDPSERPVYKCQICDKSYHFKQGLNNHMRVHNNDYRYECQYCGKKFRDCSHRKYHIFREHTGETRFSCNICGRNFIQTNSFKQHMLTHTGERAFKCEICDRTFNRRVQLKNHAVTHTNDKSHKCEVCHKGFALKLRLVQHMRIHNNERNYICPVCSKAFIQNHVMRSHVTKKHPEHILPPPGTVLSQKAIKKQRDKRKINPDQQIEQKQDYNTNSDTN